MNLTTLNFFKTIELKRNPPKSNFGGNTSIEKMNKNKLYVPCLYVYWLWITSSSDISNWTFSLVSVFFSASARIRRTFSFASKAAWRAKKFFFGPLPVIGLLVVVGVDVGVGPADVGDVAAFSTAAAVELDTIFS